MKKLAILLLVLTISLCSFSMASAYTSITASDAYNMLDPGNSAYNANTYYLLDVRTTAEWLTGHPGENDSGVGAFLEEPFRKVINIPVKFNIGGTMVLNDQFVPEVESQFNFDAYLIVMCQSGVRSVTACQELDTAGFTHIYNVLAGFAGTGGWMASGLPFNQDADGMFDPAPAPVPATVLLLGFGLAAMAGMRRRG